MAHQVEAISEDGARQGQETRRRAKVNFLPDPTPRPRDLPIISIDDHLIEPPDVFEGRMPKKFEELGPRIIELDNGDQVWKIGDEINSTIGAAAMMGRPLGARVSDPTRFEDMRRGAWDIDARITELDIDGVWASLCFPSFMPGFAGRRFSTLANEDFGLAAMRAWNNWNIEVWAGRHPDRIIPVQVAWMNDPEIAAHDIRTNERGFRAVTFTSAPHRYGYPSVYSSYWDPFFQACEETETVICLHLGSAGLTHEASAPEAPPGADAGSLVLPSVTGVYTVADWIFSKIPIKFPRIKIALSECGIGWVPFAVDRLDHMESRRTWRKSWVGSDVTASECLLRNFWFCALGERHGYRLRDVIGVDHILSESDYPHEDSTWPDTQTALVSALKSIPADEAEMITYKNAAALFDHDTAGMQEWMQVVPGHTAPTD